MYIITGKEINEFYVEKHAKQHANYNNVKLRNVEDYLLALPAS